MAEGAPIRLSKAAKEFNVGLPTVVEFLAKNGIKIDARPNTKIEADAYQLLMDEFAPDRAKKQQSNELSQTKVVRETITLDDQKKTKTESTQDQEEILIKNVGSMADPAASVEEEPAPAEKEVKEEPTPPKSEPEPEKEAEPVIEKEIKTEEEKTASPREGGPNVVGKIDLASIKSNRPKKKSEKEEEEKAEKEKAAEAAKTAEEAKQEAGKKEVKEAEAEVKFEDNASEEPQLMKAKAQKLDGRHRTPEGRGLRVFSYAAL